MFSGAAQPCGNLSVRQQVLAQREIEMMGGSVQYVVSPDPGRYALYKDFAVLIEATCHDMAEKLGLEVLATTFGRDVTYNDIIVLNASGEFADQERLLDRFGLGEIRLAAVTPPPAGFVFPGRAKLV